MMASRSAEQECRYSWNCTRINCFYRHKQGRKIDTSEGSGSTFASGVACRYGSKCTKPNCTFIHPQSSSNLTATPGCSEHMPAGTATARALPSLRHEAVPFCPRTASIPRSVIGTETPATNAASINSDALSDDVNDNVEQCNTADSAAWDEQEYDSAAWIEQEQQLQQQWPEWPAAAEHWPDNSSLNPYSTDGAVAAAEWPVCLGTGSAWQPPQPGSADVSLISIPLVGPALMEHIRSNYGRELHGLKRLLPANSQVTWLPAKNTLCASVPCADVEAACQQLRSLVDDARTALAQEQRELPVVGSTRILLTPGGAISHVLTATELVTVSITNLPSETSEQDLRCRLETYGQISKISIYHAADIHAKHQQQPAAKASCWAKVSFQKPAHAAAALAAADMLQPWGIKGSRPAPVEHTFVQRGLQLHATWQVGQPTGNAYVHLATPAAARALLSKLPKNGPKKNMLTLSTSQMVFVTRCQGTDRVLLMKLPREERGFGRRLSEHQLQQSVQRHLASHPNAIAQITMQHQLPLAARTARSWGRGHTGCSHSERGGVVDWQQQLQKKWQQELEAAASKQGGLQGILMLPYRSSSGRAGAVIRYGNPDDCRTAAAALHQRVKLSGCNSTMQVELQYCMSLPVDGRTLRAVRPQLEKALRRAHEQQPGVLVALLERPIKTAADLTATTASKGSNLQNHCNRHPRIAGVDAAAASMQQLPPPTTEGLVRITGSNQQDVAAARGMLEHALLGRVFEGAGHDDLAALLTPAGKAFLLGLEAQHSRLQDARGRPAEFVHIRWERNLNRLRLYGPAHKLDFLQGAIASKLQQFTDQQSKQCIELPVQVYRHLLHHKEELGNFQRTSGVSSVGLDVVGKGLQVTGTAAAVAAAEACAVALLAKCGQRHSSATAHETTPTPAQQLQIVAADAAEGLECPVCRCDVEQPYSLAACGHTYCHSCLEALLTSATRNNDFPVSCCADGCGSNISLADLGHLLPAAQLCSAFKAAFRAYIQDRQEEWGCCLSPDCPQVYRKGVAQFQCDCCLATWCTSCLVPYHNGQTCQQYQAWKKAAAHGDKEFEQWKRSNTKACPKCKAAIEKNQGCNHMTCTQCKTHFCWLCGQEFADSTKTYNHLVAAHGGIFDYR